MEKNTMKKYISVIMILLLSYSSFLYSKTGPKVIINDKPKYPTGTVEFKHIYTIDLENSTNFKYFIPGYFSDVDNNNCFYIPSRYDCKLFVFNENGKFVKSLGQKGEGPSDLLMPEAVTIMNDTLYISEKDKGIKVWDKNGKYITYLLHKIVNMHNFCKNGEYYYAKEIIWKKPSKEGEDTIDKNYLVQFNRDMSVRNKFKMYTNYKYKESDCSLTNTFTFDKKGNIYLFEDKDKYLITKYDIIGNKLLTFGRNYKPEKLSKEIKDAREKYIKKLSPANQLALKEFLKREYPNVLTEIIMDNEKDYLYVTVGSTNLASLLDKDIEVTVDVFDTDGIYLYAFKTKLFRNNSTIKNSRLYAYPAEFDMKYNVYEIKYNK